MNAAPHMPTVTFQWRAMLNDGNWWTGVAEIPECPSVLKVATANLRDYLCKTRGISRRRAMVIVWRRA